MKIAFGSYFHGLFMEIYVLKKKASTRHGRLSSWTRYEFATHRGQLLYHLEKYKFRLLGCGCRWFAVNRSKRGCCRPTPSLWGVGRQQAVIQHITNSDRHPQLFYDNFIFKACLVKSLRYLSKCKQIRVFCDKMLFLKRQKKGLFEMGVPNRKIGQRDFLKCKALTFWLGTSIFPNSCTQSVSQVRQTFIAGVEESWELKDERWVADTGWGVKPYAVSATMQLSINPLRSIDWGWKVKTPQPIL